MDQISEAPLVEGSLFKSSQSEERAEIDTTLPYETVKQAVTLFGGLADFKASPVNLSKFPPGQTKTQADDDPELLHALEEWREASRLLEAMERGKNQAFEELATQQNSLEELNQKLENASKGVAIETSSKPVVTKELEESEDNKQSESKLTELEAELNRIKAQLESSQRDFEKAKTDKKTIELEICNSADVRVHHFRDIKATQVLAQQALEKVIKVLKKNLETMFSVADAQKLTSNKAAEESCEGEDTESKSLKLAETIVRAELERLRGELENIQSLLSRGDLGKMNKNSCYASEVVHAATSLPFEAVFNTRQTEVELEQAMLTESAAVAKAAAIVEETEKVREKLKKAKGENITLSAALESLQTKWNIIHTEMESLKEKEKAGSTTASSLKVEVKKVKTDISEALAAGLRSKEAISNLTAQLQEVSIEAGNAKVLKKNSLEEARIAKMAAEQATAANTTVQLRLQAVYRETEALKASQTLALADLQTLLQEQKAPALDSNKDPPQNIEREKYNSLLQKLHEAEERAMKNISGVMYKLDEHKATEQELLKKLKEASMDVEISKAALKEASRKAETAEAEKISVEGELRRWRAENVRRRQASDASSMASPIATVSGRSLIPETLELKTTKIDHFAQVQQLTFPNPVEKVQSPAEPKEKAAKKPKLFERLKSFLFKRKKKTY